MWQGSHAWKMEKKSIVCSAGLRNKLDQQNFNFAWKTCLSKEKKCMVYQLSMKDQWVRWGKDEYIQNPGL